MSVIRTVSIDDLLKTRDNLTIIDVRTESEFQKGHILNAINIPLLNDAERVEIGTLYKKMGRIEAVKRGLELVGPNMSQLYSKYIQLQSDSKPLAFYCWRGGLRSYIAASLSQWSGKPTIQLLGGYKSYRTHVQSAFNAPYKFLILGGSTGSGKTEILTKLATKQYQVLDLEQIANHKGSAFGGLGNPPQPSTEMFENLIYETIGKFDLGMPILVENESRLIGNCYIPDSLWENFNKSNILVIEVDKNTRIKRLVHEYSHFEISTLIEKTSQLRKRLGGQHLNEAITALENKDFEHWIDKLLVYYDKTYDYSLENNKERIKSIPFNWANIENDLLNIEKTINHEFKK